MPKHESRTLIGSRIPRGTSGSVLFIDANGRLAQNNSQLFWDNINNRLGIGTTSPIAPLHVPGRGAFGNQATAERATRPLNLIADNAVMRVWRVNDTEAGNDPGVELMGSRVDGTGFDYWDFFFHRVDNYFAIRERITNDVIVGIPHLVVRAGGNVGIGTTAPHASASLDITSTTRGFLPPRMTTVQRDAILTPAAGLMIFNSTTSRLNFHDGVAWREISSV